MYRRRRSRNPVRRIIYVLIGGGIVYAYLVFRLGWPSLEDVLLFVAIKLFVTLRMLPQEFTDRIPANVAAISFDFWLFIISLFIALAFFAQFVLPLNNARERLYAFLRLVLYLIRKPGPAIFIENGEVKQRKREMQRRGPGVVLLDTASAAVLRNPLSFTKTIGPGTVFTKRNEIVGGKVSLYRQSKFIGPFPDEDPFAEKGDKEVEEDFKSRQMRRWETSALTRDGIEIVPNIVAVFKLDSKPDQGGTPFGYNPDSVLKAVSHEGVDPGKDKGDDNRNIKWNNLPAYLVADLWREYLRKFTLTDLFTYKVTNPEDGSRKTGLQIILESINDRLKNRQVEELDHMGRSIILQKRRKIKKKIRSREYFILKDRGVIAITAVVLNLRFSKILDEEIIKLWQANWLERARQERRFIQQRRNLAEIRGLESAWVNFGDYTSQKLANKLAEKPDFNKSLEYILRGIISELENDVTLLQPQTFETRELYQFINWVRRN